MKILITALAAFLFFPIAKSEGTINLRGSPASMAQENIVVERHGLIRIKTKKQLSCLVRTRALVSLEPTEWLDVIVDRESRYVRPWTKEFVSNLAQKYSKSFGEKFKITSAVRTIVKQMRIIWAGLSSAVGTRKTNYSSHLTGSTVDISKKKKSGDMNDKEIAWTRKELLDAEALGAIQATEEFYNNTFHVMVYPPLSFKENETCEALQTVFTKAALKKDKKFKTKYITKEKKNKKSRKKLRGF